jgi:hypothetical protein
MDIFENITVAAAAIAAAEAEIARVMRDHSLDRLRACALIAEALAEIIAEDAVHGRAQFQSRLDRYVHIHRQNEAAYAELRASL